DQALAGQRIAKPPEGGKIGHLLIQGEPHEAAKTQPVDKLVFELRITELVQMPQKEPANHPPHVLARQSAQGAGLIDAAADLIQRAPLDKPVDFTESLSRAEYLP